MKKLLAAIGCIYVLTLLFLFPKWTVDDAYITFRYAENLAHHGQLTWNLNEDPVEGYTGVALPIIYASFIRLHLPIILASQTLGVLSLLAGAAIMLRIMVRIQISGWVRMAACILYASSPFMYTHAFSGLETLLFTTVILACLLALFSVLDTREPRVAHRETVLFLWLLFVGLVRPEGVVLGGVALLALLSVRFFRDRHSISPTAMRFAFFYLAPAFLYFLLRWKYYGHLLPNTYYAKKATETINYSALGDMLRFMGLYLGLPASGALLCLLVGRLRGLKGFVAQPYHPATITMLLSAWSFAALVMLQYIRSTLMMNYSYRFFVPFFPIALLSVAYLLERARNTLVAAPGVPYALRAICHGALAVFLILQVAINQSQLPKEFTQTTAYRRLIDDEHIPAGVFLRDHVPASEWLVAHIDAGAVPFFSRLKTVDFGGLNDERLAQGLTEVAAVDYFYSFNPGAVVFNSWRGDYVKHSSQAARILQDPRFASYRLARVFSTEAMPDYFLYVYLRNDLWRGDGSEERGGARREGPHGACVNFRARCVVIQTGPAGIGAESIRESTPTFPEPGTPRLAGGIQPKR